MLNLPTPLPLRTRVPLAGWALAGIVTVFSLTSSLLQAIASPEQIAARPEQAQQASKDCHHAKAQPGPG